MVQLIFEKMAHFPFLQGGGIAEIMKKKVIQRVEKSLYNPSRDAAHA